MRLSYWIKDIWFDIWFDNMSLIFLLNITLYLFTTEQTNYFTAALSLVLWRYTSYTFLQFKVDVDVASSVSPLEVMYVSAEF